MRWVALASVAALLLAGCSSGDGKRQQEIEELFEDTPQAASGKGVIRGIVLDPSLAPVGDAKVQLDGMPDQTTDETGIFVFLDLAPGTYFIQASKPGWTQVQQSTEVVADVQEPPIVRMAIERVPGAEPRAETMSQDGYLSCSVGTPTSIFDCNTIEEQHGALFFPIQGLPSTVQTEITWESTQAAGDWLYVIQGVCGCGGESIATYDFDRRFDETAEATSPYIARATADFLKDNDAGGENAELGIDVSASGPEPGTTNGSGIALNQRFQVYATFFYNLEPDPEWSFVEDGPYPVPA